MPINDRELLAAAAIVAEEREMKVTLKCSMFGAGTAALTTFIGGLVAGPIGLLIGGTGGGLVSYLATKDNFKPLATIIKDELTPVQRAQLVEHLTRALQDFDITDAVRLLAMIKGEATVAALVFTALKNFAENDLRLHLMN